VSTRCPRILHRTVKRAVVAVTSASTRALGHPSQRRLTVPVTIPHHWPSADATPQLGIHGRLMTMITSSSNQTVSAPATPSTAAHRLPETIRPRGPALLAATLTGCLAVVLVLATAVALNSAVGVGIAFALVVIVAALLLRQVLNAASTAEVPTGPEARCETGAESGRPAPSRSPQPRPLTEGVRNAA
jgi:hypothetical protein